MQAWIIDLMGRFGYFAIAFLIAIENIFPPIPSEIILTFGGFMTTYTSMNVFLVIFFSTIGSVLGALVLYGVGRLVSIERIEKWLHGRLGRILHLKPEDVHKAQLWFDKRGKLTVFFCRFVPIIRSLISIPAGMSNMHLLPFLSLTTVGTLIWNSVLVSLGVFAGNSWESIASYIGVYSQIALIVLLVLGAIFAFVFVKKKMVKQN